MPLLNIVSSTGLNHTFYVAFVFLAQETSDDYLWALQILKKIYVERRYPFPGVVVTDRELALISSLRHVFPNTKRILCE
jgi:hypothetical protein